MQQPTLEVTQKLNLAKNIWIASVRPDGRPHLVPVWFTWYDKKLFICIERNSVKGRNILGNPQVSLALEDGSSPVICEGTANFIEQPYPSGLVALFQHKYDWDISHEAQYNVVVEITPTRWLSW